MAPLRTLDDFFHAVSHALVAYGRELTIDFVLFRLLANSQIARVLGSNTTQQQFDEFKDGVFRCIAAGDVTTGNMEIDVEWKW